MRNRLLPPKRRAVPPRLLVSFKIRYVDWDKIEGGSHFQSANREVQSAKSDEGLPSKCKKLHFG